VSRLTLIVARARNGVIGRGNGIPWRIPGEQARFKRLTMGHPIIMGRKTWESILAIAGGPLPGRRSIVVSRNAGLQAPGAEVVPDLGAALAAAAGAGEIFVIGGAQLYDEAMARADRLLVTEIDADFDGDAHFPAVDRLEWKETERQRHTGAPDLPYAVDFVTYERRPPP
jgi:dihydrofolate reductase